MLGRKCLFVLIFLLVGQQALHAQPLITTQSLRDKIAFLSSDQMKGRFPGTRENRKCARYIRADFKKAGIQPLGKHYFQYFHPVVKLDTGKNNHFSFEGLDGRLIRDYIPLSFSAKKHSLTAKVAFCGYGLQFQLDSMTMNDYKNVDVTGRWALILRGKPANRKDQIPTDSTSDYTKAKAAIRHGAAGVIFVNNETLAEKKSESSPNYDDLERLRPRKTPALRIPVLQIKREAANLLLKPDNKTIEELESSAMQQPFGLSQPVTAEIDIRPVKVKAANVVGIIWGSDPKLRDEYIVLGAHYDHLGMGGYGTGSLKPDTMAVHNGADDNASGTAAIMTIGAQLAKDRDALKRNVIVVAFNAEEEGLLGSQYFTDHPPVPLDKIKVMVNLDMVGHLDWKKELYIGGCGTFPQGVPLLDSLKKNTDMTVYVIPGGVGGSDHVSFYRKDIPVLGLHTGGHPEYHTPQDDLETLNIPGEEKVCRFVYEVVKNIANTAGKIGFVAQDGH